MTEPALKGPAPLEAIPEAPVPDHGAAEWFTGAGGATLRAALFSPDGNSKGSIVLSPGRSEPIEKYFEVVQEFLDRGFTVLAHDWRGQGLSQRMLPDRLKGHAQGFTDFVKDYRALLDAFEARLPKPWIAVGHSMGGGLTALVLAEGEARFAGAMLSAPMLGLLTPGRPHTLSRMLAWVMARTKARDDFLFGEVSDPASHTFESEALTHDRARYDRFAAQLEAHPDLALGNITWGWLDFAFSLGERIKSSPGVKRIAIPVTLLSAELDNRVENADQRAFIGRLAKGKFIEVAGAFHEILMETDPRRAVFWQAFDALWEVVE